MNETLLITGASSGVGLSLAKKLSGRYHVIAAARRIDRLNDSFGSNDNVSVYQLDLSNLDETESVIREILDKHGYIPYVINNAGIMHHAAVTDLMKEDLLRSLHVNAIAPYIIMKSVLPGMRKKNFGRMINVTSGAPLNCSEGYAAYSGSKAVLNALTVTAAKENAAYDIKINLMSPGPCKTEISP
ncbi:MAG: SDR family NAD(P)-dependent oxidoreductase, partial [Bacillota bacterium]|nr:SDR family NAD(P)-dependent oxidoreductase [Bacillota bacterium]